MSNKLQAIRGMNDILPADISYWQLLESTALKLFNSYGFGEIRLPLLEKTDLFARSIGVSTDIVEKEMYTFEDRNGDSLTLRPEGTASVVRAGIERGLLHHRVSKLWYSGPMFRHERPQKGRYRQFHQIGAECFGLPGPGVDAEVIIFTAQLWQQLGLSELELQINSLGDRDSRAAYKAALVDYLQDYREQLDEDSQRRLTTNPLRILDSKNSDTQALLTDAPSLLEFIDSESSQHFNELQALLIGQQISFRVNDRLVRGLDYYNRTVFEWVTNQLGAQGTVCAGGRYDGLVEQLGGRATPAVGFAMGEERLVELLSQQRTPQPAIHVQFITLDDTALPVAMSLAQRCRSQLTDLRIEIDYQSGNPGKKLTRADKAGVDIALIIGSEEASNRTISVKLLRENQPQQQINQEQLIEFLADYSNRSLNAPMRAG